MDATRPSQHSKMPSPASKPISTPTSGNKRKAGMSPPQTAKGEKTTPVKSQKTLEETIAKPEAPRNDHNSLDPNREELASGNDVVRTPEADSKAKEERQEPKQWSEQPTHPEDPKQPDNAITESAREGLTPSSILEKGLIYFFLRGRVGIEDPSSTQDVARSYIILRSIPHDAALGNGVIDPKSAKYRVLALPKKVLPSGPKDRFMMFVEHAAVTAKEIKERVLGSEDYTTKTAGVRHAPSANPIAEGVYTLVTTGRETHLAYNLTRPKDLSEVERDIGLANKGSFVCSAKNPVYGGPGNASLSKGPDFPKDILDEFRSLRWTALRPRMLDYENAQMLLIGSHSTGNDLEHVLKPQEQKNEADKAEPIEELEILEGEDESRARSLEGDEAASIFADLALTRDQFSGIQTEW